MAAMIGITFGACGRHSAPIIAVGNGAPPVAGSLLTQGVADLCTATDQARSDPKGAASTFYQRSHTNLHLLASALELVARAKAARLLEAMFAVEHDIAIPSPAGPFHTDLSTLTRRAGADLPAVGLQPPACVTRSAP